MKKLLLIVPALHQGGLEKVCVMTARLLQPYFKVTIVIFDSKDIAYDIEGLSVIDLKLPSKRGTLAKITNVFRRGRGIHKIKKAENIDIAYSFGPTANLANIASGGKAEKWLGIRSYMDMENPKQIRLFCRHADRLLCCSQAIYDEVRAKYGAKQALTLQNPFDIKEIERLAVREEARLPWSDGRIIISMGREDTVKGFWHLIKAFYLVQQELTDTKLMIIGKGEFTEYRKLAEQLGIGEAVYFAGLQKNPYPYLKKGTLYALTSYHEGFPNALVEAMALGVPAIATDCMTGPGEILEDKYGILIPNMSPEPDWNPEHITEEEKNLASQITALLKDEKRLAHYREMAVKRAGDYTVGIYVGKIRKWAK